MESLSLNAWQESWVTLIKQRTRIESRERTFQDLLGDHVPDVFNQAKGNRRSDEEIDVCQEARR